jgi:uncharacterized protein
MTSEVIWIALGLVLVFEGLTYALVPGQMQKMMARMLEVPPDQLRLAGTAALAIGVFVIWMASGTSPA